MSRTASGITWVAGACTLLALALLLPRVAASSSDGVREIHLVARDMTYYVDGRRESNPTLRVARGKHVRIRLTNNDPGMSHDFSIRAWKKGSGLTVHREEAVVEFTAPREAGETTYACTPHGEMMRGTIRVE
jgi:plastocyanin